MDDCTRTVGCFHSGPLLLYRLPAHITCYSAARRRIFKGSPIVVWGPVSLTYSRLLNEMVIK